MTSIKLGDKKLIVQDGCNVDIEIEGDEIKVSPKDQATPPAPQPVYVPLWTQPFAPIAPIYPVAPLWPYTSPGTTTDLPTITCGNVVHLKGDEQMSYTGAVN